MKLLALFFLFMSSAVFAGSFTRVDQDMQTYYSKITAMKAEFAAIPSAPESESWIKAKVRHMCELDQYFRVFWMDTPFVNNYSPEEKEYFENQDFLPIDEANTNDIKELLRKRDWFKISQFGEVTDSEAWVIVQHADHDPEFQKQILSVLSGLFKSRETDPQNYAYLFDRVATSYTDPSKRVLQRYGTQGRCVAKGSWEPFPMEDPENIDVRRAEADLPSLASYIAKISTRCP